MNILHCFADTGVESEALAAYGEVTRVGLDPEDTPYTDNLIQADAREVNFDTTFDLGLFHPPCHKWTQRADEDAPNLIPVARRLAEEYCENYIIENQPRAPLHDPVVLDGRMFNLPVAFERAFETNYYIEQPPRHKRLTTKHRVENEHSYEYWQSIKGYGGDYDRLSLIMEAMPRAYLNYLVRPLL
jgi:hypothetical protein